MLEAFTLTCPHCGERFETLADGSGGDADYIEDCPVCCRPIRLRLEADFNGLTQGLHADRDD